MKSGRRSNRRLASAFQHRNRGRSGEHSVVPMRGAVNRKRASQAVDLERLLHMSQQLYAHALTLEAVIRHDGEVTYEALRPRFDQQAAQQFEIFYHSPKRPSGSGAVVRSLLNRDSSRA